ncbi:uncharacterized protein FOMMEDRAFT_138232 [Fomitiporia mediterranea MF3/22]|uniref:uncharacterized protein n=1 Tax=Fomitiporia mediterranea (strain MF3/22) TaxID=694068 RepID=UPI000440968C|nr:uncharacterized protein FOMMEDRAFT_138232 [Fomitiporia mediterranea MF3/22]EJD08414.1 hypothetical protein FOMMEDRAFT_138232 [Fomitiporia mediterranea MF3/22]
MYCTCHSLCRRLLNIQYMIEFGFGELVLTSSAPAICIPGLDWNSTLVCLSSQENRTG